MDFNIKRAKIYLNVKKNNIEKKKKKLLIMQTES